MNELYGWQFEGSWLQLVEDRQRAGSSSVTLVETDFEKRLADLNTAGIPTEEPMRGEKLDVVILKDPDGNQVVFAHGKAIVLSRNLVATHDPSRFSRDQ